MRLADLYREWKVNGTRYGGVGRDGHTEHMHIEKLALLAIEELEAEIMRLQTTQRINSGKRLFFDGATQHVEIMLDESGNGNHGRIVNRPQVFEINEDHPLAVGMTGGR